MTSEGQKMLVFHQVIVTHPFQPIMHLICRFLTSRTCYIIIYVCYRIIHGDHMGSRSEHKAGVSPVR